MSNIKVTVEYETPKTDNFFNLLQQYEEVRKLSKETVNYYKPLAEMAEQAKMTAILEQLETIKEYLIALNELNENICGIEVVCPGRCFNMFKIDIIHSTGEIRIWWKDTLFKLENLKNYPNRFTNGHSEEYNILGNWDKWNVYCALELKCNNLLENEIKKQKERAEREKARLLNITGEV